MNHRIIFVAVFVTSLISSIGDAEDKQLLLDAAKDTVIYKESGKKSNGSGEFLFAGQNGGGSARRSLLQFDLTKIPKDAKISKVSVVLKVTRANKEGSVVSLHRINSSWGEGKSDAAGGEGGGAQAVDGDATWENAIFPKQSWNTVGADFKSIASAKNKLGKSGKATWTSKQLTQDVQDWIKDGSTNFGWILIGDESQPGTAVRFSSRSNEKGTPQLLVEYSVGE